MFSWSCARGFKYSGALPALTSCSLASTWAKRSRHSLQYGHNMKTRGPWALMLCFSTNLAIGQSSTYTHSLSTPRGQNWAYLHPRSSGFRDTGRFSKLPFWGMKVGHWPKFQKLHIYFFLPQGGEIKLVLPLRAAVLEIRADFRNCHIWAWNSPISQVPEVAIHSLSTPWGRNWAYFGSTGSGFRDTGWFSKLPYLGMKVGKWPKFKKLHI